MNWYEDIGEYGDIAVSTRVRLARNLKVYPFPGRMSEQQEMELLDSVSSFLTGTAGGSAFRFVNISDQDPITVGSMVEHHLISPELAIKRGRRGVVLSENNSVCIMINEEDHLRIQSIISGLNLKDCMVEVSRLDDLLDGSFHYAWSDQLGYLTHCPTNLGTGLRASVMLHLPSHTETGEIRTLVTNLGKLGFAVRGLYGEGSKAAGSLYQVSNQMTLGLSETETVDRLDEVVRNTIERERTLRKIIGEKNTVYLEDRIWRAYGILSHCRRITGEEAMNLLSDLRTGVAMDLLKSIPLSGLNKLISDIQSNSICSTEGKPLSEPARNIKRAGLIRELLKNENGG